MPIRFPFFPVFVLFIFSIVLLSACSASKKTTQSGATHKSKAQTSPKQDANTNADGLVWFAKKQLNTPYKYGSADPKLGGLDCSGFLYYVFTHFNIKVPRSSYDYSSYGQTVSKAAAQKGDVIIFTGSNADVKKAGHVGIITEVSNNDILFIHSSTSKGVIINKLSDAYYSKRFLKIVRVLK